MGGIYVVGKGYDVHTTNPMLFSSHAGIEKILNAPVSTSELDHLIGINQSLEQLARARLKEMEGQMPTPGPPQVSRVCSLSQDSGQESTPNPQDVSPSGTQLEKELGSLDGKADKVLGPLNEQNG